jgi:hypothetical protein
MDDNDKPQQTVVPVDDAEEIDIVNMTDEAKDGQVNRLRRQAKKVGLTVRVIGRNFGRRLMIEDALDNNRMLLAPAKITQAIVDEWLERVRVRGKTVRVVNPSAPRRTIKGRVGEDADWFACHQAMDVRHRPALRAEVAALPAHFRVTAIGLSVLARVERGGAVALYVLQGADIHEAAASGDEALALLAVEGRIVAVVEVLSQVERPAEVEQVEQAEEE